jgi:hypothetical protein
MIGTILITKCLYSINIWRYCLLNRHLVGFKRINLSLLTLKEQAANSTYPTTLTKAHYIPSSLALFGSSYKSCLAHRSSSDAIHYVIHQQDEWGARTDYYSNVTSEAFIAAVLCTDCPVILPEHDSRH